MGTLVENVARVKADFKLIKDMAQRTIGSDLNNVPTSEYAERMENGITSNYDVHYNWGIEQGRTDGYNEGYSYGKADGLYEGVEQGRQEVISNSKYIEKTVSGKGVFLNDVSEVAHKVKVYADTPTEVKVCGKNLFNNDTSLIERMTYNTSSGSSSRCGYKINNLPAGVYTFTFTNIDSKEKYVYGVINNKDGKFVRPCSLFQNTTNRTPLSIVLNDGDEIYIYNGIDGSIQQTKPIFEGAQILLEHGSAATSYEKYEAQTITATPDGIEIDSSCFNMTFISDGDISVRYFSSYGMNEARDYFWDNYQANGTRTAYGNAYSGAGWTNNTFKPKYNMAVTSAANMFIGAPIENIVACLNAHGVIMDFSKCTGMSYGFQACASKTLPYMDLSSHTSSTSLTAAFNNMSKLERIDGIKSSENTTFATNTFAYLVSLTHCIFEGVITSNIDLHWSTKLSRESILSLLQCLNATVSGKTITLPSKCIDTATDTLALIQGDTELNTAYTQALSNGYTITFA